MKRFTKTMAALGLAAVMGTGSAFISLADVTTSVNPVATSRKSGWVDVQNHWYYFDENGRTFTDESVHEIDGKPYCFDEKGAVEKENQWVKVDGKWKYWLVTGDFQKSSWLNLDGVFYYLDEQGNVAIGWKQIDDNWYYFKENGTMATDSWIGEDYVDATGAWRPEILKEKWISSGEKWW